MSDAHLHLWEDRFLYATHAIASGLTARASGTVLLAPPGRTFTLVSGAGEQVQASAAWVPPLVARRLDASRWGLLSLNIDPAAHHHRLLADRLGSRAIRVLAPQILAPLAQACEGALHGQLDAAELQALCDGALRRIAGTAPPPPGYTPALDPRVRRVAAAIRRDPQASPLTTLAEIAGLSADRLTHLFREQAGLSVTRYALWAKIRRAIQQMREGAPLTQVALAGGFSDSAHMSRTFQSCFGLAPSFLSDPRRVQLSVDDAATRAWPA
ncbi:AraC family transcriptional regulator [uncultured Pseudacidovorax sp.]|uniref:helix-turn-helix domain-containing protein n=1 Tax=uncultured Pseudacidovorax sp. TaxID=679313 RepID=UPI0025DC2843|nr:AraC family transcriptional regulator [uncultured Pseudacidovorax sp.]